jgi:drug/metabolite transporter (DMT)-like permease
VVLPSRQPPHPHHRPLLALALRIGAAMAITTMFMLGKLASEHHVALPEIMFWRQAITLPLLTARLAVAGKLAVLRTQRLKSHAMRGAIGMTGMTFNFGAVAMLHLAESTTFNFTAPLFAVLLAALVLREPVGPWRWSAVVLGFVGVLLITRPGGASSTLAALPPLGIALGLLSALFNAIISYLLRDLGRTEHPICVVFWFAVFGTSVTLPLLPFVMTDHDAGTWALLIGLGVAGTLGQVLMTAALKFGSVASVIVMDYTQLIWATLFGLLIWGQQASATLWLGAPLVIAAGLVIAWREYRLSLPITPVSTAEDS